MHLPEGGGHYLVGGRAGRMRWARARGRPQLAQGTTAMAPRVVLAQAQQVILGIGIGTGPDARA